MSGSKLNPRTVTNVFASWCPVCRFVYWLPFALYDDELRTFCPICRVESWILTDDDIRVHTRRAKIRLVQ